MDLNHKLRTLGAAIPIAILVVHGSSLMQSLLQYQAKTWKIILCNSTKSSGSSRNVISHALNWKGPLSRIASVEHSCPLKLRKYVKLLLHISLLVPPLKYNIHSQHLLSFLFIHLILSKLPYLAPEVKKKDWKTEVIINMLIPLDLYVRTIYHIHCLSKIAGVERMQILFQ